MELDSSAFKTRYCLFHNGWHSIDLRPQPRGRAAHERRSPRHHRDLDLRETSTSVTTDGGTPDITTTTYDHDPAGNLTEVASPEGTWTYSYDGFSRMYRARRTVAGLPAPVSSDIVYDSLDRTLDKDTTLTTELAEVTLHSTAHRYRGLGEDLATTSTTIDPVDDVTSITTRYGLGPATTIAQETTTDLAGVGLPDDVTTHVLGTGAHHDVTYLLDTSANVAGTKT